MFHPEEIMEMQREAAANAARLKSAPMMIWPEDVGKTDILRHIPNIGNYLPDGWERIDPDTIKPNRTRYVSGRIDGIPGLFVDNSGFGAPTEPAMTFEEFANWIVPNYGYAVVEEGQFQITIGVFRKI